MTSLAKIEQNRRIEACFATIVGCAKNNLRCPETDSPGFPRAAIRALIITGRIRVYFFGHNFRVIEILKGNAKGLRTAPYPSGGPPWKTIDANGTRELRHPVVKRPIAKITLPEIIF